MEIINDNYQTSPEFILITGLVIVYGPTNNGNGSLDVDGMLVINGGTLVALGSSGMAQSPSTSSTQYSVLVLLQSEQAAGTLLHIEGEDGQEIVTIESPKSFQSIVISTSDLENGSSYVVYAGGTSTGTSLDGLYSGGSYTPGSQVSAFTISSIVTGESVGMPGGGPGGRGN